MVVRFNDKFTSAMNGIFVSIGFLAALVFSVFYGLKETTQPEATPIVGFRILACCSPAFREHIVAEIAANDIGFNFTKKTVGNSILDTKSIVLTDNVMETEGKSSEGCTFARPARTIQKCLADTAFISSLDFLFEKYPLPQMYAAFRTHPEGIEAMKAYMSPHTLICWGLTMLFVSVVGSVIGLFLTASAEVYSDAPVYSCSVTTAVVVLLLDIGTFIPGCILVLLGHGRVQTSTAVSVEETLSVIESTSYYFLVPSLAAGVTLAFGNYFLLAWSGSQRSRNSKQQFVGQLAPDGRVLVDENSEVLPSLVGSMGSMTSQSEKCEP